MIYLDNAATTPLDPQVLDTMLPYLTAEYGNASSLYDHGQRAKLAVTRARKQAASLIGAQPSEIYFTSGGTESDNWALIGAAEKAGGGHIITTSIEHHAVLNTCAYLEKRGFHITYLTPDHTGMIDPEQVRAAIRPDTFLVSIMTANNEIGTIQRIREIGEIVRAAEQNILFHTDAVQAVGHIPVDVEEWQVDLLSASAHKLNGPKGVGLLYMRRGVKLPPFLHGGQQESGRRAGTENTAGIAGFGKAAELAGKRLAAEYALKSDSAAVDRNGGKTQDGTNNADDAVRRNVPLLRDHMIGRILSEIPGTTLNGGRQSRLPGNVNICFDGIDGQQMVLVLNQRGVCVSAGAACASGDTEPSHVLKAIGVPYEKSLGSIRFSIDHQNTWEEINEAVDIVKETARRLRSR